MFKSECVAKQKLVIYLDYFAVNKMEQRMQTPAKATRPNDILMEKAQHYCKIKNFTSKLGQMFNDKSDVLLCSKYLQLEKKIS